MPTTVEKPLPNILQNTEHSDSLGFTVHRHRLHHSGGGMPRAHTHPDIELNYAGESPMTYLHGGTKRTFAPGTLLIFWAGVPHQMIKPPSHGVSIWSYLPLPWLFQWKLPNDFSGRLLSGELLEFELESDVIAGWPQEHASGNPDLRRLLQLELHATLLRLAINLPSKDSHQNSESGPDFEGGDSHIARVTAYLAQKYDQPITIDDIASEAKLNRNYLMRLFQSHCHISIWEYLTRLRISHAQRLLTTTNLRVVDIAMECGFGSVAPFYAAFSRYCDTRPLDYRRKNKADT